MPEKQVEIKGARSLQMRPTGELTPYANNARTHTMEQVLAIARSMDRFGFTNPILLDGNNGIIAGHGRLQAAIELNLPEVPCIDLHGLSESEKQAYVIADNQLAMQAGWDYAVLAGQVEDLAVGGFDVSLLGFNEKEMATIERMGANAGNGAENTTYGGDRFLLMVEFVNEIDQQQAFQELQAKGWTVKVLT
jgi:hypothetical protein